MKDKNNKNKAVIVKNLSKYFSRGHRGKRTLKEYFVNPFSKVTQEKFKAVDDMSFEIEKGEFFGIIGRNGSGKSTLLKMLAGIYKPDKGEIEINGRIVPFLELGVGFNPDLTARENIFLNGTILGMTRAQVKSKFDEIVSFAEIEKFVDTPVKNFSSGMYVRLAFAIAVQAEAELYLIDEILAVGDFSFQQKCFSLFRKLKKSGKTFIFVSHDLSSIREFCDRCMYIKDGKIQQIGAPSDMVKQYVLFDRIEEGRSLIGKDLGRDSKKGGKMEISILNEKLEKVDVLSPADAFRIRLSYELEKDVLGQKLIIGIGIYKDGEQVIYGTNSLIEDKAIEFKQKGTVDFVFKSFPLLYGHYGIQGAIHNSENYHFVWLDNAAEFDVAKTLKQDGLVNLDVEIVQID